MTDLLKNSVMSTTAFSQSRLVMHLKQADEQTDGRMDRRTNRNKECRHANRHRQTSIQAERDEQAGCRQPDRQELDNQAFPHQMDSRTKMDVDKSLIFTF